MFTVTDSKGRRCAVPGDKITYVEIGTNVSGTVASAKPRPDVPNPRSGAPLSAGRVGCSRRLAGLRTRTAEEPALSGIHAAL